MFPARSYSPLGNFFGPGSRFILVGAGRAATVAALVAGLTGVRSAANLPHANIGRLLNLNRALRNHVAWCPLCLAEWQALGGQLYFPLLWAFRPVRCCVQHHLHLQDTCPGCGKVFPFLNGQTWDFRCSTCRCGLWEKPPGSAQNVGAPTCLEVDAAKSVQSLVAWLAQTPDPIAQEALFLGNLGAAVRGVGGAKTLARSAGLAPAVVRFWKSRRQNPSLNSLLRLSLTFGIPLRDWFNGTLSTEVFSHPLYPPPAADWLADRLVARTAQEVQQALRVSLATATDAPPSLNALAKSIPASPSQIHHNFPALTQRIVRRHRIYISHRKNVRAARNAEAVHLAISELRDLGRPVTADAVLTHLGSRWALSRRRLRAVFTEIMTSAPPVTN